MGIVKTRSRIPKKNNKERARKRSFSHVFVERERKSGAFFNSNDDSDCSGDDSNNYEFSMPGCEPVALDCQHFCIPYELYDLSDLKYVLSVKTWNDYLSEEERFILSAYLPEMDQDTYMLTMHELLAGEDIFFGSPLSIIFQRLKGGFYSLEVAHLREALQSLEMRVHYHYLKSYHENMIQLFISMKRTRGISQSSTSIQNSSTWEKDAKPAFIVDLNAFPEDDCFSNVGDDINGSYRGKRTRHVDRSDIIQIHKPAAESTIASVAPMTKPKGFLSVKPLINTVQSQPSQTLTFRSASKGVLKIKPKSTVVPLEVSLSMQPRPESIPTLGLDVLMTSPVLPSIKSTGYLKSLRESPLVSRPFRRGNNNRHSNYSLRLVKPKAELANHASTTKGSQEQSVVRKSFPSTEICSQMDEPQEVETFTHESMLTKWGTCSNYSGLNHNVPGHWHERRRTSTESSLAGHGIDDSKTRPEPSHVQSDHRGNADPTIWNAHPDGLTLPITYRRKKSFPTQSSSILLNQSSVIKDTLPEKRKSVKIKLKIWNE